MFYYVYTDHAQYTIKIYAKMALFPLILAGPLSVLFIIGDAAGSLAAIWACPAVGACLGSASFRSIVPGFTGPLHAETTTTSWGST